MNGDLVRLNATDAWIHFAVQPDCRMRNSRVISIEDMLRNGEAVIQPVSGVSMFPMLDEHTDAVRLVKPSREIEIGDVVMYKISSKRYVLHRVCGFEKDVLIIRGDNCVSLEYVPKKRIIALMDGYIKKGKFISNDNADYREYVNKVLAAGKPLIPEEWTYIIQLYKAAITETAPPSAPNGIDWERIVTVCAKQSISSAIATVVPNVNPTPPENVYREFSESFYLSLRRTLLYDAERSRILHELDKEHIRYLPMKAIIIKALYPKAGMREFADNDILYEKSRQGDLVRIMTSLGYEVESLQGVHDVFCKKPIFSFEMHKALFDLDSPYADFFSDIFDRTIPGFSGIRMSDEDFYLHFLAHYAKHHERSGSGLRPLGDLFLLQKFNDENPTFNRLYVDISLEKLGLVEFEKKMISVADKLFRNGQPEDDTIRYIMSGSAYGSLENAAINAIRSKGRFGYLLSRLFLPYWQMKRLFPLLKPMPFLLPIYWIIRLVEAILNREKRKTAKRELHILSKKNLPIND